MTPAELQHALEQQQAENAALRVALAKATSAPGPASPLPNYQQLVLLMQQLCSAVLLTDANGRVAWANEGFSTLCGFELHEVVGRLPETFLHPDLDDPATVAYIEAGLRNRVPFQFEVPNPRASNASCWIRVKVQPVVNEQGEAVMACLLEDITEWKESQLALAENEQRFRALAENVPVVLYEWRQNFDGTFGTTYMSPKLSELFGIPVTDFSDALKYAYFEDMPALWQSIEEATRTQTPWFYEGRVAVPGQPLRWIRGSSVLTGRDETGVNYSGILQDITPLRQALREADLRWRLAVEGFGDGIWEQNLSNPALVTYSADYKAMLGYQEDEFPDGYASFASHIHPEDLASTVRAINACLRGDVTLLVVEFRMRCKDGSYKWILSRGLVTERAPDGEPLIFSGTHTDISELKKAQEALDASMRRLSTVITNFQDGLVLEDENRRIVLTNEAFCSLLAVPTAPAQLIGKDGGWLTEGSKASIKNPQQYVARIKELLKQRQPVVGDVLTLLDGRTLQRDFAPIFDQSRYIGHLWKYADITIRTQASEELKRREEKYRGIIENMSLGLVEADLEDHLLYVNQSFCSMTGFCTEELMGRQLSPLLLSGEDLALVESKKELRQQGIADSYEIAVTTKSGEIKWLLVSAAPLYDDHQRLIGFIGIYLDVTPQKRLEANLREAKGLAEISSRAKQDFLANMSHEIRTPMNAILGMSQLLTKTALDSSQTSYLHAITASAENLLVIINDILDLSKIEAGRMAIEKIGFSPERVAVQVEKTLVYKAEEKGLCFETRIGPGVPPVLLGDPYRITQILLNLAGNAVKFTEKGGVNVSCELVQLLDEGEALIEFMVKDNGIGIDAEYLAQVFEDFSQEDSSVSRKFGGTGLGLGISKNLVELLGGTLRIESQKNSGTTSRFTLCLPVGTTADVPQKDEADTSSLLPALRGKRILLVEDNVFNRMLANIFLTNAGMEVTEAENGQVAVTLAESQAFDLILMDLQMPLMNGYVATAMLRQQLTLTVPIIALTANAITGERGKCLAAGMNDYLTKPFQEAALVKLVHDWTVGPLSRVPASPETGPGGR
ncbi:hypothetical protein BEN47_13370 [Hymenobacter lapidarius]|uniref:histidine kinase n=1 Tax=Hymenobacter lapidarius TaxID=1908237 RepID=A0A1G1T5E0_9BACT|nr:PAS domain S-box protein [Hymenobacter lapidarius]OGX86091.1 hypothetical protein BEN47_13370 [Hymenobacter lapidarius]